MAITDHKISQAEIDARNLKRLGATSTGTADDVQELFDKLPEYAISKHNALIDELSSTYQTKTGTADNQVFTDTNSHYTTDEVGEALVQAGSEIDALELLARPQTARAVVYECDFFDASANAVPGMLGVAMSGGYTLVQGVVNYENQGVISISSSSSANSGYRYMTSSVLILKGGEFSEMIFCNGSSPAATVSTRFGFHDSTAIQTAPTDGAWIELVGDGTAVTVSGKTATNTTTSTTASTYTLPVTAYAPNPARFHKIQIEVNSDATLVTFRLIQCSDGSVLWSDTLATNIPAVYLRNTNFGVISGNTGTSSVYCLFMDYMSMAINRTLVR